MFNYCLKRIAYFIPTLFVITLLAFIISVNAPGDAAERLISGYSTEGDANAVSSLNEKKSWQHRLGLDLPLFYFSLSALSDCDTLNRIPATDERKALTIQINQTGNTKAVETFHHSLQLYLNQMGRLQEAHSSYNSDSLRLIQNTLLGLLYTDNETQATKLIQQLTQLSNLVLKNQDDSWIHIAALSLDEMYHKRKLWRNYIPVIRWHPQNQYHRWLFGDGTNAQTTTNGLIHGDFGISYTTKTKVSALLGSRIAWSLFFSLTAILTAYFIAIPLGVFSAVSRGTRGERIASVLTFMLPALPAFWVATLLLMTFANPTVMAWLPASGVKPVLGFSSNSGFLSKCWQTIPYLILPFICYTYGSIAFLSRTVRIGMLEALNQDYIRTAKAKGLSNAAVIWKHAFRNSLLPLITVFANVFPAAIGGSVILETIFTLPGMGSLIFQAIGNQDYPVIIAIFTLTGILTLVGYLISDVLYAWVDPRIKYD